MKRVVSIVISLVLILSLASQVIAGGPPPTKTSCGKGKGTMKSPHVICNQGDFVILIMNPNMHYQLGNNMTIIYWEPIPQFSGTLDGKNYTISLQKTNKTFISVNYGTVKNLSLNKEDPIYSTYGGALVNINQGIISNVQVNGNIHGHSYVGGIVGENNGLIEHAKMFGNVYSKARTGGIASINGVNGVISQSTSYASVGAFAHAGGIVAFNQGVIKNSTAYGNVTVVSSGGGGLVAHNYSTGTIKNSNAFGNVYFYKDRPTTDFGKLFGINDGKIKNSYGRGNLISK